MYDHMCIKSARDAGFGDQLITTNPIESVNATIKRWNNFTRKDAHSFLEDMKKLILYQQVQSRNAFLNLKSDYKVKEEFCNLVIENHPRQKEDPQHSKGG